MITDRETLRQIAIAVQSGNGWTPGDPNNDRDHLSFVAVYAACGSEEIATEVCDGLREDYIKNDMTVSTLQKKDETVFVDGEALIRKKKWGYHGMYLFAEDEQKWYMYCNGDYGRGGYWRAQNPFNPNSSYYRQDTLSYYLRNKERYASSR